MGEKVRLMICVGSSIVATEPVPANAEFAAKRTADTTSALSMHLLGESIGILRSNDNLAEFINDKNCIDYDTAARVRRLHTPIHSTQLHSFWMEPAANRNRWRCILILFTLDRPVDYSISRTNKIKVIQMKQIIYLLFTVCALFLSGCIELQDNQTEQTCTVEKFCENGLESVCGEDGVTYACPALALCEGVAIDRSGDSCTESRDCPVIQCDVECPNGFKKDAQGCDTCECKEAPAETCGDDACVPFYCGSSRGQCIRESELATIGNCPAGPFNEPEPQCGCTGEECAAVICEADADCGDGLCVRTPEEDRPGYCVDATCDDIAEIYQNPRPEQISCQQDDECMVVASLPNC